MNLRLALSARGAFFVQKRMVEWEASLLTDAWEMEAVA
jgi:hypothetical protein